MTEKRRNIIIIAAVSVVFLALLIVATFYDLEITRALADLEVGQYQSNNIFGRIFETIGEMPVYLITLFAASIIIANLARRKRSAVFVITIIILEFISIFAAYYAFHKLFKYLTEHFDIVSSNSWTTELSYVLLGAILVVAINVLSRKYSLVFLNSVLPWAVIVLATVALSQFFTQVVIKIPAGRYRYCTMNTLDDFSHFTKWFCFNGKISPTEAMLEMGIAKDGMKSFPSGHTCAATTLITLTSLPMFLKEANTKKYKIICWCSVVAFVLIVMLTRLIMGKHFLSDVLIGGFVTVICYYVCLIFGKKLYDKKIKLQPLEKIKPVISEERI